jgi:hypothetical protein
MITRLKVREMLYEAAKLHDTHITMAGEAVPFGCPECIGDIEARISDTTHSRNNCSGGTAARGHYSGVLHQLRKDRRAAAKIYERDYVKEEELNETPRHHRLKKLIYRNRF